MWASLTDRNCALITDAMLSRSEKKWDDDNGKGCVETESTCAVSFLVAIESWRIATHTIKAECDAEQKASFVMFAHSSGIEIHQQKKWNKILWRHAARRSSTFRRSLPVLKYNQQLRTLWRNPEVAFFMASNCLELHAQSDINKRHLRTCHNSNLSFQVSCTS